MDLVHDKDLESKTEFSFASQLTYGPFGSRICTPVCALVSSNFLFASPHLPIPLIFDSDRINRAMLCSHDLYTKKFAKTSKNLMYQDIISFFPTKLETLEFAGLLESNLKTQLQIIDNILIIFNLSDIFVLLHKFLINENTRFSLMITFLEHTICFLFDFDGSIWCFDPLQASLVKLNSIFPTFWGGSSTKLVNEVEYAGLLLLPGGCKNKLLHFLQNETI
jgi:hypothetical protein